MSGIASDRSTPNAHEPHEERLKELERSVLKELRLLNLPAKDWSPARTIGNDEVSDVIIIGAGMSGLCAAAALRFAGISRVRLLDKCEPGREGPWVTYARMNTLRTPKEAIGPALGIPSLTYRAWHEARFGAASWDEVVKAPRKAWMDYLNWFRSTLAIQVENETTVTRIAPTIGGIVEVRLKGSSQEVAHARRVVLATGFPGFDGGALIPDVFQDLPKRFWAHSSDMIDFRSLSGKRVGVLGVGASALDNAATALEHGASRVDLIVRRPDSCHPEICEHGERRRSQRLLGASRRSKNLDVAL